MNSQEAAVYLLEVRHHLNGMIDQQPENVDLIQLATLADDRIAELARYMKDAISHQPIERRSPPAI